ncbi:MAG: hypothetical protein JNM79_10905 [Burkholderiales bacterium]|nr:hypothetical protein [Burkholderiales bacterium]
MPVATRLSLLRYGCAFGLMAVAAGMAGILLASQHPGTVKAILGVGFLLTFAASGLLVLVRCPACGQRFTGSQSGGDVAPYPNLFTKSCRHCGHVPE